MLKLKSKILKLKSKMKSRNLAAVVFQTCHMAQYLKINIQLYLTIILTILNNIENTEQE